MDWHLRHASHLGYLSPEAPLFRHSVNSLDPVAQVEFAAEIGFAGVQDVWAPGRPEDELVKISRAIARHGLEGGCVAWTAREKIREPLWSTAGDDARAELLREVERTIEVARRLNSRHLVIIGGARAELPKALQLATFVDHLRAAADLAANAGIVLAIEAVNGLTVPNMLLHHAVDAFAVVRAVNHPNVKMIFDTGHAQAMDGNLLATIELCWPEITLVQFADNPGRTEPGSGEINFANIVSLLKRKNYTGLIEWEHGWSEPLERCERIGIETMARLEAAAWVT